MNNGLKRRNLHKWRDFLMNWKKKIDWNVSQIICFLIYFFLMFLISSLHIFICWLSEVKLTVNPAESDPQCLTIFWMSDLSRLMKWQWGTYPLHVLGPVALYWAYFHLVNYFFFSTYIKHFLVFLPKVTVVCKARLLATCIHSVTYTWDQLYCSADLQWICISISFSFLPTVL